MAGETVRARVWIRGRVQGVGFRFFVQRRAQALRLAGFVRNLRDGRVELEAEGPRPDVEALIEAVRAGPPGAMVERVHVEWEPPRGTEGFAVRTDGNGYG